MTILDALLYTLTHAGFNWLADLICVALGLDH
jgi:hypothetical protein